MSYVRIPLADKLVAAQVVANFLDEKIHADENVVEAPLLRLSA